MLKKFLPFILLITILFCGCYPNLAAKKEQETSEPKSASFAAAWVATIWNIDFPSKSTTNDVQLKKEIDQLVLRATTAGLDALFFQVRPSSDAFYKSSIFPWSRWLTGAQGLAPDNGFDPLEYIIAKAHEYNIQLHAWINPYRITTSASEKLVPTHPASLYPELTIDVDGKLYFNPGEPLACDIIIEAACEIVQNYAVDGIHYDDYFYPENITIQDMQTWINYGEDFDSVADWRRNNINELIRQTYQAIKTIKPSVSFGVSPSGIWANKSSNVLGSDTRGFQSYYAIYADSRSWIKKGYVDYIAPQIYWYIGQSGCDFFTVLNWWNDVCKDTSVALYVGLAGYKYFDEEEYENQIKLSNELGNGYIIFSFCDL